MIGVDVGGTFTDVVAVRDGQIEVTKVATDVAQPQSAVLDGAARLGVSDMPVFNHASTHGLNAVITRNLPKVGFLTTEGHRDMLDAGRCIRPRAGLTDPAWRRGFSDVSRPLVPRYLRLGVRERILASGDVLMALDEDQARQQVEVLARCGVRGVAICTLNAYVNPAHEEALRRIVHEVMGEEVPVSISSEVSPLAKEYTRASTTIIDVFMQFIYGEYAAGLDSGLAELGFEGDLNFADCAATLMSKEHALAEPYQIVFAGPAAGTVSSQHFGTLVGLDNILCCDVGGTSTDISIVSDGKVRVNDTFELEHDLVINALSTEVSSVGAGGGSIVSVSPAGDITVGPQSAGAEPGPVCYGRGGTAPTVTDACLLMGIIDPGGFAGGELGLDPQLARESFERLEAPVDLGSRIGMAYQVAVNNIAEEITNIAIRHGLDTRDFSIQAYGAAGPMLLPAALDLLRSERVLVPPHPGLFSALGLLSTDLVYSDSDCSYLMLEEGAAGEIDGIFERMEAGLSERLGAAAEVGAMRRSFDARLSGQSWEMPFVRAPEGKIDDAAVEQMVATFHDEYETRWGQRFDYLPVQAAVYRVEIIVPAEKVSYPALEQRISGAPEPRSRTEIHYLEEQPLDTAIYDRGDLLAGDVLEGPAVIREPLSTTIVCPGQTATVGTVGELAIEAV